MAFINYSIEEGIIAQLNSIPLWAHLNSTHRVIKELSITFSFRIVNPLHSVLSDPIENIWRQTDRQEHHPFWSSSRVQAQVPTRIITMANGHSLHFSRTCRRAITFLLNHWPFATGLHFVSILKPELFHAFMGIIE